MKGWKLFAPLLLLCIVGITLYLRLHREPLLLQGEADAISVVVSSKAHGRVATLHVQRGDDVKQGDLLVSISSPEIEAQVAGLEAARAEAQAQVQESDNGTREEDLRVLRAGVSEAETTLRNAERDFQRLSELAAKGFYPASQLDDARRQRDVAREQVNSARANLAKGESGDRDERREALSAALAGAEAQLQQLQAQADDLQVRAPVDGEVGSIPAEQGTLVNAYSPLLTLVRLSRSYFVFNLREDILAGVRKGDLVALRVPALGDREVQAKVGYIAPLGDFATKRATRATGDFDLKTFEVRLYPEQPVEGLRPGMSALWQWSSN
ncbi:HlyD family secretion protein [Pseudomonas kuykendallii]|uniref:Secretion protein HlyD n=1 Tax=Pseudomonas kuykendallii TaxID=1007099 RepID=A0A2W5D575_9PSED|nr:efflux RND transporter periplasmic adaptor subunit [Pseudomonas kuykendallii]PZP24924.1 MAG: secretion protein HlyD [Pseudomonas kuykendallii]